MIFISNLFTARLFYIVSHLTYMLDRFSLGFQHDMCEVKISRVCPLYGQCHLQVKKVRSVIFML